MSDRVTFGIGSGFGAKKQMILLRAGAYTFSCRRLRAYLRRRT